MQQRHTDETETLLFYAAAVLGALSIYFFVMLACAYHVSFTLPFSTTNKYLRIIINREGHINIYTISFLILASVSIVTQIVSLIINKIYPFRILTLSIAAGIYTVMQMLAKLIMLFTKKLQIKTSIIFGLSYLIISLLGAYIAVYEILPMEYWHPNIWFLTVTPLITASIGRGAVFIISNFIVQLDPLFPRHFAEPKQVMGELGLFFTILLGGSLIMLLPIFTQILGAG